MPARAGRIGGAAALVAAALVTAAIQPAVSRGDGARETAVERAYASAINDVRAAHGLTRLTVDASLVTSSRGHSSDMVDNQYFAHGAHWWKRLGPTVSASPYLGEN